MIEITVGDCGCSVSQHRASPLTVTMNYCPRHAAADAMYEALNGIEKYAKVSLTSLVDRQEAMGDLNDIIEMAREARARADGDGGE